MSSVIDRIGELLTQLQSPDFYEREKAVKELGTYDQDEAVAGLVMALEDPDLGIRELAAEFLGQIKGNVAPQLLIKFLGHGDIGTRNLAAEILVRVGNDAVPNLVDEIDNDDHDIRKFIVDVLGLIRDERAVEPLCRKLSDENTNVVCSAAEALGEIGSSSAIDALVQAYRNKEDARLQTVEALGKIGDPRALAFLEEFLDHDDPMVLYATIEAIGNIGAKQSVNSLLKILDHKDHTIGESALMAIINISIANGGNIDHDLPLERFTGFLFEGIKNKNKKVTRFTLDRLSHWYGNNIIKSLLNVLNFVEDEELDQIVEILGKVGPSACNLIVETFAESPSAVKLALLNIIKEYVDENIARQLLRFAGDADPDVRQNLAYVLGLSGCVDAIPTLKVMTGDSIGHVRSAAYAALGWLCTEEEVEFLFKGLDDKYADVREAAMGALIIRGSQQVVKKFNEDLYHENVERQRLAAMALGMIGDASVVEPLIRALNHPEPSIRKSVIDSLGKIREVPNVSPLILALNDENGSVRKSAVSALVAIKGGAIVPDIRFLLDDEDIWVRYHMINVIGDLGQEAFSEYIIEYLESDQDIIKIAAIKALAKMRCRRAVPAIAELRREKNTDVVEAAETAISSLQEVKT